MDIASSIITIGSLIVAILAWLAKIRWSKEFEKAKDETIKAKEAQIIALEREVKSLQNMTPMKLREYFNSVKEQLEEYNTNLKQQLEQANLEIEELERKQLNQEPEPDFSDKTENLQETPKSEESFETKVITLKNTLEAISNMKETMKVISEVSKFLNYL